MKNSYRDGKQSVQEALRPYLREGEKLLWHGTPYEAGSYHPPLLPMIFVVIWLCFAAAWTASASVMAGVFGLFGIAILAFGGGMLWFLTGGAIYRASRTLYAFTEERALILTHTYRGTVCTEYNFSKLTGVTLRLRRNGSGTLELVTPEAAYLRAINYGRRMRSPNSFEAIANAEQVYRLLSAHIAGNVKKPDIPI